MRDGCGAVSRLCVGFALSDCTRSSSSILKDVSPSFAERRKQLVELVDYPRESPSVEIKNWIDLGDQSNRAHVGRELLALGNSGGGFLIFGFDETGGGFTPASPQPSDLSSYGQDAINAIVAKYAEPRFSVEVELVPRSGGASVHPVVIVPGDLDTPVRASRDGPERKHIQLNTYYVRRPGPESAPIQTGREWDALLDRCVRTKRELLIDRIREIIQGPEAFQQTSGGSEDHSLEEFVQLALKRFEQLAREGLPEGYPGRYAHGTWYFAYRVVDHTQTQSLASLRTTLEQAVGHETGWPPWWLPNTPENAPRPWDSHIECWMASGTFLDASHSDYWLADPRAMLFLLRGYKDDSGDRGAPAQPGRKLDLTLPVWRMGACLLHAERFATAVARDLDTARVNVNVTWTGLAGRELTTWASGHRYMMPRTNHAQDSVRSTLTIDAAAISERLPEIVQALTQPLYEAFEFFEPPPGLFSEELEALRGRRNR